MGFLAGAFLGPSWAFLGGAFLEPSWAWGLQGLFWGLQGLQGL